MTKSGSILRGFLTIAGAVIAAALADQVLMGYLPPWGRSVLGLAGVAFLAYRGYIDSSHKDAQDSEKEALQSPIRNMADAAKDAVLDQGKEEVERSFGKGLTPMIDAMNNIALSAKKDVTK